MVHETQRKQKKLPLSLDIQFFAEGGGDDGAGGDGGGEGGAVPGPQDKAFSQAELDRIVADRIARERKKFADYDEKATRLAELEAAEAERKKAALTAQERLEAEKAEAEKRAQEAADQAQRAQEAANKRVIDVEIRSIARALNAADPSDVLALIDKSVVTIDDDGNVVGAEDAVKAFKEAKPHLFKAIIGADAGGGSNPPKNPNKTELAALEAEYAELQKQARGDRKLFGKLVDLGNKIAELKRK